MKKKKADPDVELASEIMWTRVEGLKPALERKCFIGVDRDWFYISMEYQWKKSLMILPLKEVAGCIDGFIDAESKDIDKLIGQSNREALKNVSSKRDAPAGATRRPKR